MVKMVKIWKFSTHAKNLLKVLYYLGMIKNCKKLLCEKCFQSSEWKAAFFRGRRLSHIFGWKCGVYQRCLF